MLSPQKTSPAMELLPFVSLCLLTCSAITAADGEGSDVINVVVKEDSDAILPCSLSTTSIKGELFDWKKDNQKEVFMYDNGPSYDKNAGQDEQFKGRVFHFEDALESGNASIIIRKTRVTDTGSYTCDFPYHQPKRRSTIALVVEPIIKDRSKENIPGAAAKPSVTSLNETKDWSLLQCEVRGASPKPEVEWQDSSGKRLPAEETHTVRGGRYDISLQTTVTKTDFYHCVATQKTINHQTEEKMYAYIHGATGHGVAVVNFSALLLMVLLCLVLF